MEIKIPDTEMCERLFTASFDHRPRDERGSDILTVPKQEDTVRPHTARYTEQASQDVLVQVKTVRLEGLLRLQRFCRYRQRADPSSKVNAHDR